VVSRLTFETLQHAEFANRDATSLAYKIHTHNLLGSRGARNETGEMNINEINLEKLDFFPVSAICHQYSSLCGSRLFG